MPVNRLRAEFAARYPGLSPRVWRAPGRVNLIGEHTDYNGGLVLPIAISLACYAAVAPVAEPYLEVESLDLGDSRRWPLAEIPNLKPTRHWTDYFIGVAQQLLALRYPLLPQKILVHSTVPVGAGLSSSAALEVASALALLDGRPIEKLELVQVCHRAENQFVGLPCGMMDQFISVFGEEDSALLLDCRDLSHRLIRLPRNLGLLAVNTMVKHELSGSAYRDRVAECAEAARLMGLPQLRDPEVDSFRHLDGVILKRARHVISENGRVENFVEAAAADDPVRMGQLMVASHQSLQRDYEVSCAELDFLAASALGVQGVLGSRMTGGGFGGCTINLMNPEAGTAFRDRITTSYRANFRLTPEVYPCHPSPGAGPAL